MKIETLVEVKEILLWRKYVYTSRYYSNPFKSFSHRDDKFFYLSRLSRKQRLMFCLWDLIWIQIRFQVAIQWFSSFL